MLLVGAFQGVDPLLVVAGAEGGDHQGLRLAAGEQGRAVGAGEHAHFRHDRAHGGEVATVDAAAVLDDVAAQHVGFGFLEGAGQLDGVEAVRAGVVLGQGLHDLGLGGADRLLADHLVLVAEGGADVGAGQLVDGGDHGFVVHRLEVDGVLGGVFGQFDDRLDHRLEALGREGDAAEDGGLVQLLDFGFDHHHRVVGAGDDEVHLVGLVLQLVERRVEDVLAVRCSRRGRRRSGP